MDYNENRHSSVNFFKSSYYKMHRLSCDTAKTMHLAHYVLSKAVITLVALMLFKIAYYENKTAPIAIADCNGWL